MRTRRSRGLRPLGDALRVLVAKAGLERPLAEGRVFNAWSDVVGAQVAARARPVRLVRGHLVVSAASSAWACELQLWSGALVEKLNAAAGERVVGRVSFRVDDLTTDGVEGEGGRAA